jgi:uncharacterized membrane protein
VTLERILARGFALGTWSACVTIAVGLGLFDVRVVKIGIAMFIALPVVRIAVMLGAFVRARDYRIAAVAAAVLFVLAAGLALGLVTAPAPP